MSILKLSIYPDPVLKEVAQPVSDFSNKLKILAEDMLETMYLSEGIGLAAPQVGQSLRLFVLDVSEERNSPEIFINPTILSTQGSKTSNEGCLSIPGYRNTIKRFTKINCTWQDLQGKEHQASFSDMHSICIQHENDHLDGILFVDKLSRLKREHFKKWLMKNNGEN